MRKRLDRTVLTEAELHTPGLVMLGRNRTTRAQKPMPLHTHVNCIEMVVVMKGHERYFTEGREYGLSGGEVFLSLPDQPHGNGQAEQGISEFIWFQIHMAETDDFLGLSRENGAYVRSRLLSMTCRKWTTDKRCMDLLEHAFLAFAGGEPTERLTAQGMFFAAIARLMNQADAQDCREEAGSRHAGQPDAGLIDTGLNDAGLNSSDLREAAVKLPHRDAVMAGMAAYIRDHLSDPLEMQTLCGLCRLSESAFKRRFKDATGQTPREYINHRKIERAKQRLEEGAGITETAMALGFSGSDYFSVVFKRHTATTPTEYRKAFSRT